MSAAEPSIIISEDQRKVRLDAFLAAEYPDVSRSVWQVLIKSGRVTVNGKAAKANHKVKPGEVLAWELPEEEPEEVLPEEIPLQILYEDEAILVLNKPAGLVVHPAAGNEHGTLVNGLLFHDRVFEQVERAGIVHRLDKDTSGVMVVAKTAPALEELQRQFKDRETQKEYLALVWGVPNEGARIETLIGRHPVQRKKMAVLNEGGREAVSEFSTLERYEQCSLVRVRIETGRTHQIRVHMAHVGHPVVGDSVYGRNRRNRLPAAAERQMLHAARLAFVHPVSGERLAFEAPLFEDMERLLERLRGL